MVRLFDPSGEWPMLFNSYSFIFLFLPVVLLGYFALGHRSNLAPVVWLTLASLVFYAFGGWQFVPLLLVSIAFNYGVGYLLIARKLGPGARFAVLATGVAGDLVVLGIFKYAGFFAANLNALFSAGFVVTIVLPYTFLLYFDFSGYSDMAIGMSLMFGIFLPLNFNSPYKAVSIIDFWRRWHMTL